MSTQYGGQGKKRGRILLHICCAPCSTHAIEALRSDGWEVGGYFYNPNIFPVAEYTEREAEAARYCMENGVELITGEYDADEWEERVGPLAHLGEGSKRCTECFAMRFERCARAASGNGYNAFTTTLSISPHKNSRDIFRMGEKAADDAGIPFMKYDFKKKDGFRRSVILSREHRLYRQDYCGCRYSLEEKTERDRKRREREHS